MHTAVPNKTGVLLIRKKEPQYWVDQQQCLHSLTFPSQTSNICTTVFSYKNLRDNADQYFLLILQVSHQGPEILSFLFRVREERNGKLNSYTAYGGYYICSSLYMLACKLLELFECIVHCIYYLNLLYIVGTSIYLLCLLCYIYLFYIALFFVYCIYYLNWLHFV